jgi:hypothetical protein
MSQVLTKTQDRVREAWEMIERAQANDTLTVGVALDYVMDGGCSREDAKLELYRHAALLITQLAAAWQEAQVATFISNSLWDGKVSQCVTFVDEYFTGDEDGTLFGNYRPKLKRWVKLCSWVEGVE